MGADRLRKYRICKRSEGILARRGKMCCKHAAKEITDLDRSKRSQHLQCNNERTTASQNASGKDDYNRQREQYEGDYAKT